MKSYTLYGGRFTRGLITEMVFAEGKIPYSLKQVDTVRNEHLSQEFLAINPAGRVPVLITPDNDVLYESPAINLYLIDEHPIPHLGPASGNPDRGQFLSGLFYISGEIEPAMKRYFYPNRYAVDSSQEAKVKLMAESDVLERLDVIEKRIRKSGPYFLGADFSLLDIVLSYWVSNFDQKILQRRLPRLQQVISLVSQRPALAHHFEMMKVMAKDYAALQAAGGGVT